MNDRLGWALAALALAAGWMAHGWQGVILVISVIVFWLLLQFSRTMRVLKMAAGSPVGRVDSAVMLQARLRKGMTMAQVIPLTRSLGRRLSGSPEVWEWADDGDVRVEVVFERGRCQRSSLHRPGIAKPAGGGGEA